MLGLWYGNLVENAKLFLQHRVLWSLGFVHREGNQTAHLLAKNGLCVNIESVWLEEPPNVILHIVLD